MSKCEDILARMTLYLDDELEAQECGNITAHLAGCASCRASFDSERRLLENVRGCGPLYVAPPELRARVENSVSDRPMARSAPPELRERIRRTVEHFSSRSPRLRFARPAIAVAAVLAVAILVGLWLLSRSNRELPYRGPSQFAMMAADTHQRHIRGQLPLELVSDVPEQISNWFAGKLPFTVKLPNYQESSGQEKTYQLEGARLVGYRNDYAAYVAYQMRTRPISLVVTSDKVAQPTDGEQIVAKEITFHYNSINGLKVLTWSDGGLTYALVSDLEERGQESCVVCHQGVKDKDFIEPLKPR
ncbi:MAG TPA: zf-HC2 domain-containing protein [Pyrinomonadaceae bacterium]|nr:zf-HC2 domain-containing protein [Pyrinomonadaceae bacterium]